MHNINDTNGINDNSGILSDTFLKEVGARFYKNTEILYFKDPEKGILKITENAKTMSEIDKITKGIIKTYGVCKNGPRLELHCSEDKIDDTVKRLRECSLALIKPYYALLKERNERQRL